MEFEVPSNDEALLKQMANVDRLPEKLIQNYWELKRIGDRISSAVTLQDMKWLCFGLGLGKAHVRVTPTIVDLWKEKKVKGGDTVLVKWRGAEEEAKILRIVGSQVQIELNGNKYKVEPQDVRVAELVEV